MARAGDGIKVVVTGGSGFIGSHTAEHLVAQGCRVQCLLRPRQSSDGWLRGLPVERLHVELTDPRALRPILRDADYVVHIAGRTKARRREEFYRDNVIVTRSLLSAAADSRALKNFCHVSSLTVVGPSPDGRPLTEEASYSPITAYGFSKMQAEEVCREFAGRLPIVILRPPAVYGPRDRDILEIFRWVRRGIAPVMGSSGKTLSLIHVTDLARGLVLALTSAVTPGKTYFISDGVLRSYRELIGILAGFLRVKPRFLRVPAPFLQVAACVSECWSWLGSAPPVLNLDKVRDLLAPHWICDSNLLRAETGFEAEIPIEAGLRATWEWYTAHGWL